MVATSAAPVARADDVLVGIGDQSGDTLSDPLFKALEVKTVRIVLPWDVATQDPKFLRGWAITVQNEGLEPLVALGHSRGDKCPSQPCTLPSDDDYLAAFRAIHNTYPWIRAFTPWNEPNHSSQPTAGKPLAAAHFANLIASACADCTIVVGDMLDAPGYLNYVNAYKAALDFTPAAWALHNYYDTNYFSDSGTKDFLAAVDGPVWITESGGIVTWRTADGQTRMPYDESRAAASVQWALTLAGLHSDRVARLYVYQWRPGPNDDFDAGLLRADGTTRPGYSVLKNALTTNDAPALDGGPAEGQKAAVLGSFEQLSDPAQPTDEMRETPRANLRIARVVLGRQGRSVRVSLDCATSSCVGKLALEGAGWAAERYVNGRLVAGSLASRHARFNLAAGAHGEVVIALPRRVAALARRRGLRLIISAVPSRPADGWGARTTVRLRVPRPPAARP